MVNTSLKQALQNMHMADMPTVVIGIVQSVSPIEIVLADDSSIILYDSSLTIPSRLLVKNEYTPCGGLCQGDGKLRCKKCDSACEKLAVGDEVYMLAVARDKVYYVLDRV